MPTNYNLEKIKFATDPATFERAVNLYEKNKITRFEKELNGFFATVIGTKSYNVYISKTHFGRGSCDCYLGERDILCKHMVATAIYAVKNGKPLKSEEKEIVDMPICSGKLGELNKEELLTVKKAITQAIKYIKSYQGPSKTWFAYQNSLNEGCARLSAIVSKLPVSQQTADLLIDLLLRLDKKLCTGGVDDSNGAVGGFIEGTVITLQKYTKLDKNCIKSFEKLYQQDTCFGWESPLIRIFDERDIDN
ncbi:MAG: hypothetical protein K9M44_04535 [Candidatus Pacebacteria bacterium]|nr:hypothetical protein [Candidatus Paceibacterota bacterium]